MSKSWWTDDTQIPGGLIQGGPEGTFSEGQQEKFGVAPNGDILDEGKFKSAVERVCKARSRVTPDKLKVLTIRGMLDSKLLPEADSIVHVKGFGNGLSEAADDKVLTELVRCNCKVLVWDGDLLENTGFTKMVPRFLDGRNTNPKPWALAFVLDYEVDDFRESWAEVIEQYPGRIVVVAVDMKTPTWHDAANQGITDELKDTQGLPDWAHEYFLVGRLACKTTGSKQVFSLGGGGIAAHEAKAGAKDGVVWTIYALSRGREEQYPTLADWAAENPSSCVYLRRNLDPNEAQAFSKPENKEPLPAPSSCFTSCSETCTMS